MQNHSRREPDPNEANLIAAAQTGSREAFDELFRRSSSRLHRAAMAVLASPNEVEDVVQAAACNAYLHISAFRQASSFNTWLTSIVVNQARMRRRELRRASLVSIDEPQEGTLLLPQLVSSGQTPEEQVSGNELLHILHREIRRLPIQLRQVMLLYLENLSMTEAADRLDLSLAAAKTRLFRARRELHNRMRRYIERPQALAA